MVSYSVVPDWIQSVDPELNPSSGLMTCFKNLGRKFLKDGRFLGSTYVMVVIIWSLCYLI